jgi:hypothetical protein
MAAPKGEIVLNDLFNEIITDISENGKSAISAMKGKMSSATFYDLIKDAEKLNRYARATEMRSDKMAEDILEISDNVGGDIITLADGREVVDQAVINRDRLRVDARKWLLAKMNPKKYGDKIDMTSDNKALQSNLNIVVDSNETAKQLKELIGGAKTD